MRAGDGAAGAKVIRLPRNAPLLSSTHMEDCRLFQKPGFSELWLMDHLTFSRWSLIHKFLQKPLLSLRNNGFEVVGWGSCSFILENSVRFLRMTVGDRLKKWPQSSTPPCVHKLCKPMAPPIKRWSLSPHLLSLDRRGDLLWTKEGGKSDNVPVLSLCVYELHSFTLFFILLPPLRKTSLG